MCNITISWCHEISHIEVSYLQNQHVWNVLIWCNCTFPHSCCACAASAAEHAQACTTILLNMLSSRSAQRGPCWAACSSFCSQPGTKTLNSVICRSPTFWPRTLLADIKIESFFTYNKVIKIGFSIQTRHKNFQRVFPKLLVATEPALKHCTTLNINLNNHAVKTVKFHSRVYPQTHRLKKKKHLEIEVLLFCNSSSSYCKHNYILLRLHAAADGTIRLELDASGSSGVLVFRSCV